MMDSRMPSEPTDRPTSRLLVIDEHDRLLLFRAELVARQLGRWYWFAPGGGVEDGESHEQAALRELWEETGLDDIELGPLVWRRTIEFESDRLWRFHERYFVVRTASFAPEPASVQPDEQWMHDDGWYRWWSLDDLRSHEGPERIVPRYLDSLLPPILAGDYPAEPLELFE
jgi:8-oxo-dGTP pyrophosphatase MutT (NUDIX family)